MRLYLSDAIEFVRARMDELSYNNDDMIVPADDDRNFDTTVEKLLPEAAEFIFRAAPARLLEPQDAVRQNSADVESHSLKEDGSLVITIDLSGGFLRLVSFKSDDSDIYVTQTVPFDGPSARMQANLYVRGTWDDPVLVERKVPGKLELRYYSVRNSGVEPGFTLYKINKPSYSGDKSIFSPDFLTPAILNRLTAMVLEAYGSVQQAQAFYQKSANYYA